MTGTLTIAVREMRERSFVFAVAALTTVLLFIMAMLTISRTNPPRFFIMIAGIVVSTGLTLAVAIALGTSMITRELSERRLSFYFSKPVSAYAIWFGKLAGAALTVVACFAITFVPSFLAGHSHWHGLTSARVPDFVAVVIGAALCFLVLSHAVATIIRSRSPLVALDLALLAILSGAALMIVRPLFLDGAVELTTYVAGAILLALPVAILAGGAWQLSHGRTDIKRSHRELSKFFWIAMATVVAIAGAYVAWVFSAGPRDIHIEGAASNATGDWLGIAGPAAHRGDYRPTFLVDLKSGRSIRLAGMPFAGRGEFNRTGEALLSVRPTGSVTDWRGELQIHRLKGEYAVENTGIEIRPFSTLVVSDDLRRVAVYERGLLSVYDITAKSILASVKIPFGQSISMFFVSADVVRVYARTYNHGNTQAEPIELRIYEFNAKRRQLAQTGSFTTVARSVFTRTSADGSTLLVNEYGGPSGSKTHLLDSRTGVERATLPGQSPFSVAMLTNGGAAYLTTRGDTLSLVIVDPHAALVRETPLGPRGSGHVREVVPGKIYVASVLRGARQNDGSGWTQYVVDGEQGKILRAENQAQLQTQLWSDDPRAIESKTGEYVIADAKKTLWRWNALTGAKSKIF